MKIRCSSLSMLAAAGFVLWGTCARADFTVTYLTSGTFTSSGTPTFTSADSSTTITYTNTGVQTVTVPPPSQVSLGSFTVASTSATPVAVVDTFTLDIVIIGGPPAAIGHTFVFNGVLHGTASATTATGNIVFTPLAETFGGLTISIASFDSGVPGAVNLGAPTTNGGMTTLNGVVNTPEPSSVILMGIGGTAFLGVALRRRLGKAGIATAA